tara:strand:- start:1671 stop:1940 length:270 start_codon:yes stop_codon:yes gene_type:complete
VVISVVVVVIVVVVVVVDEEGVEEVDEVEEVVEVVEVEEEAEGKEVDENGVGSGFEEKNGVRLAIGKEGEESAEVQRPVISATLSSLAP